MLGQWATELNHVTQIVGGFNSQEKYGGQDGVLFTPVPKQQQASAVRFLNENAFTTPAWAIKPEVLGRISPVGTLDLIKASQLRVLNSLMSGARFNRLVEQEAMDGAAATNPRSFWRMCAGESGASSRPHRCASTLIVATCSGLISSCCPRSSTAELQ